MHKYQGFMVIPAEKRGFGNYKMLHLARYIWTPERSRAVIWPVE